MIVYFAVCLIATLQSLLLPAVQAARESKRQMVCAQNLKQIGLAMHAYHQKYGSFPPAYIAGKDGKPKHSWRLLILPFLDQEDLYREYRFDEPWNGPHNSQLAAHATSLSLSQRRAARRRADKLCNDRRSARHF